MNISSKYNPDEVEEKWYQHWLASGAFDARVNPSKPSYTIVIPPPNVTGVLHMGHMLNNTIQDVFIRRARMDGKEACWVPGTDHASIATEARVVAMLREQGIKKSDLSRDEFLTHAWAWKEKYGGIILDQLKKLGASCDWKRTHFTMDEKYYQAVIRVFVDLYRKGYIYRGLRMIHWDCEAKTALSNEEVMYNEDGEKSILYHIRYAIENSSDSIVIATQRPETIFGDVAIAVNPDDERYKKLVGKKALVPFIHRPIPIIADAYVDKSFGSGCLKVTPAHDQNDYDIGMRHNLPVIDTINLDGTINEKCGWQDYIGRDRFVVRKMVVKDLKKLDSLVKEEEFITRIGRSERTNTVIEPKLSLQWFMKMKEISQRAKEAVEKDEVKLHPAKFKNTYLHWMDNVRDWCISRQLWWGHRIPVYFFGEGENDFVVAETIQEAATLATEKAKRKILESELRQESDVLDTWASSWLWPLAVFDGFNDACFENGKINLKKNNELHYFYPTQVLVTAPEILFFWVARMMIAGYEYTGQKPFHDVYLTGIVRDKQGRKMSKSLGNSPDPLELIKKYSADGVRLGMLFSSPAGNDLLFDEKLCEQGRNFCNKIWNAFRLIQGWTFEKIETPTENKTAVAWFESALHQALREVNDGMEKYRITDAVHVLYKLVWDDFCSRYLEMIKPEFEKPIDEWTGQKTMAYLETLLKILHPFTPFISEEIWHAMKERTDDLIKASSPVVGEINTSLLQEGEFAFALLGQIRNVRQSKNISPKEKIDVVAKKNSIPEHWISVVEKIGRARITHEKVQESGVEFLVNTSSFFIPIAQEAAQDKKAVEEELNYHRGFLASVLKKLSNEKFIQGAPPDVIEKEKQKQRDAETKITALENVLKKMG